MLRFLALQWCKVRHQNRSDCGLKDRPKTGQWLLSSNLLLEFQTQISLVLEELQKTERYILKAQILGFTMV